MNPWQVVLIGIGVVFSGLVMIIAAIKIMTLCTGSTRKKESAGVNDAALGRDIAAPAVAPASISKGELPHSLFVALSSVAIAQYMDKDIEGLRIHSIKPLSNDADSHLNAVRNVAIAAAIASSMDSTPEGLRIHSVKSI